MRPVSVSSVRVDDHRIDYEIGFDGDIGDGGVGAISVEIAYRGAGDNRSEQSAIVGLSNVSYSGSRVFGSAVVSDEVDEVLSSSLRSSVWVNSISFSAGGENYSLPVEDFFYGGSVDADEDGYNREDSQFVGRFGNYYLFDGPVFRNLTTYGWDSESQSFLYGGSKELIRKSFEVAEQCGIAGDAEVSDPHVSEFSLRDFRYYRNGASVGIANTLSDLDEGFEEFDQSAEDTWGDTRFSALTGVTNQYYDVGFEGDIDTIGEVGSDSDNLVFEPTADTDLEYYYVLGDTISDQ